MSPTSSHYSAISEYIGELLPRWECDPSTYRSGRWHAILPTTSEQTTDYEICGMKYIPGSDGKLRKVRQSDALTEKARNNAYLQIITGIALRVSVWLPEGVERKLTVGQLIALWDIEWNTATGIGGYPRLRAALERRDDRAAAREMVALRARGGVIEPGLIKRSAWRASQFDYPNWARWATAEYSRIPKNVTKYTNYRKFLAWYAVLQEDK